jgi:hypothetical protein
MRITTRCEIRKLETRDTSDLEGGGLGNLDVMKEPSFQINLAVFFSCTSGDECSFFLVSHSVVACSSMHFSLVQTLSFLVAQPSCQVCMPHPPFSLWPRKDSFQASV